VQLTQHEVKLLLRYGYPFEESEAQMQVRGCNDREKTHTLKISDFDISHWIGDLV